MTATLTNLVGTYGLLAIFLTMTAESCGIPIPSEVVVPVGGLLAATGRLNLAAVILTASLANLTGSWIAYLLANRFGEPLLLGPGRYVGISGEHVRMADGWFRRYGLLAVFFGRMLPVVRTYISFPAGLAGVPRLRFAIFTLAGAVPWNTALALAGFGLGTAYDRVSAPIQRAAIVIAVLVLILLIVWFVRGRRAEQAEERAKTRV